MSTASVSPPGPFPEAPGSAWSAEPPAPVGKQLSALLMDSDSLTSVHRLLTGLRTALSQAGDSQELLSGELHCLRQVGTTLHVPFSCITRLLHGRLWPWLCVHMAIHPSESQVGSREGVAEGDRSHLGSQASHPPHPAG